MHTVGHRRPPPINICASAEQLAVGARFNDEIQRRPCGNSKFIAKGIYRFETHDEANLHQSECLARGMAAIAQAQRSIIP